MILWNFASCWRLKAYYKRQDLAEERICWDLQREVVKQKSSRSKRLHSIPEVAEEDPDGVDGMGQHLCPEDGVHPGGQHAQRRLFSKNANKNYRHLQRQRSSPRFSNSRFCYNPEEWNLGHPDRQSTKSPDSGLDCGSEEEGSLGRAHRGYCTHGSHMRGPVHVIHCEGPVERRALAMGRKRTLTRQCSVEEELSDSPATTAKMVHMGDLRNRDQFWPGREAGPRIYSRDGEVSEGRLSKLHRGCYSPHREARAQSQTRDLDHHLVCDPHFLLYFPSTSYNHSFNVACFSQTHTIFYLAFSVSLNALLVSLIYFAWLCLYSDFQVMSNVDVKLSVT